MKAPIAEAMKKYSLDGAIAFHTPGHKQGLGSHSLMRELITEEGLRREVSLMEELDDIHSPNGCIKVAQALSAKLWKADEAFFIVNGTSGAIQAMMMSVLKPNDEVLVPRNAHRSVMNGLILTGAKPIYLTPEFDEEYGINLNLKVETVEQAIKDNPKAKAMIIVSPNYYGVSADLKSIAKLLHERNMILMVDEAHGTHLTFSEKLPMSAIESGADLSAQSTHKLLGSLTQTSMLMVKTKLVDVERVRRSVSMLQTTSPNYLLLASLDIARLQMQEEGANRIEKAIELSQRIRNEIATINGLKSFESVKDFELDLTKVTVNVSELGMTGIEAEKILRYDYKVQCELSDENNLLFLITYADNELTVNKLIESLKKLSTRKKSDLQIKNKYQPIPKSELKLTPREAFNSTMRTVKLNEAMNEICGEEITFYPPGIPILQAGEIITKEMIDYIQMRLQSGERIIGANDTKLKSIKIIEST